MDTDQGIEDFGYEACGGTHGHVHGVTIVRRLMAKGLHVRVVLLGRVACLRKQRWIDVAMGLFSFSFPLVLLLPFIRFKFDI